MDEVNALDAPPLAMTMRFIPATKAGSTTVILSNYESFVLGRDVPGPPAHTYEPFWDVFQRTIEQRMMPRTLIKITAEPKEIEIKFDLGYRGSSGFTAVLMGERITPDRVATGVARRSVPRSDHGFVLELSTNETTSHLELVASFGEAGIKTLVETHEAVGFLRDYLLDVFAAPSKFSHVLAIALRAVDENPTRTATRHVELIERVRWDLQSDGLFDSADDLIRHVFARVFVWIRTRTGELAQPKVSTTPPKARWVGALRALGLETVALRAEDKFERPETTLYRSSGTIEALVLLADQLDENGVITFADLARQLRAGDAR